MLVNFRDGALKQSGVDWNLIEIIVIVIVFHFKNRRKSFTTTKSWRGRLSLESSSATKMLNKLTRRCWWWLSACMFEWRKLVKLHGKVVSDVNFWWKNGRMNIQCVREWREVVTREKYNKECRCILFSSLKRVVNCNEHWCKLRKGNLSREKLTPKSWDYRRKREKRKVQCWDGSLFFVWF